MPVYEYRCLDCDTVFEQRRPMAEADDLAVCPDGHARAKRLLAMFASARTGGGRAPSPLPMAGGGGCGTSCGCHH